MMGSGKTTVGEQLARRMGRPFVDTDAEIEREAGDSVAGIFAREGEAGFRARERAVVEALAGRAAVVSLGGGAVAQPGVAARLAASGTVVYLRARPETLLRRVGDDAQRPLLRGLDAAGRLARLRDLLAERAVHYEGAALTLDTDDGTPEALADQLAAWLLEART